MPFSKGARIEIENQCDSTVGFLYYYIDYVEMDKLPDKTGRFHAWYNHELTDALPEGENVLILYHKIVLKLNSQKKHLLPMHPELFSILISNGQYL